jgi:hypothetical protein
MRLLLCHPGAVNSIHDVFSGLRFGLQHHGVAPLEYRLDVRAAVAHKTLHVMARQARKVHPDVPKPTSADVLYEASIGMVARALRHKVDAVLIVSAMYVHPDALVLMKRAGLRVCVLFTETPYDLEQELRTAAMVDGCWTTERSALPQFRAVNTTSGYLPHAWHPETHRPDLPDTTHVSTHDVVFVGSGWSERVEWFNAIDWEGINLGIYGPGWLRGLKKSLRGCVHDGPVTNAVASALYRRAKVGLNLYRNVNREGHVVVGESLSPRAYELAACGVFHLSEYRPEVREVFGALVPTFRTPTEAAALMRMWLADDAGRAQIAAQLPARVAEASWIHRTETVLGDLETLLAAHAA